MPVVIWLHPYSYSKGYSDLPILPESSGASAYRRGTYALRDQGYLGTDFKVNPLVSDGYAIFTFDMIGFGTRIPEAQRFYERFPHWSLMGKMVDDVRSAVDLLSENGRIDPRRIYVMGYSLGATVGMIAACVDDRIAGAVSVCGFTPLRAETSSKGTGALENLAFIHGLMPRLGFFKGHETRLPWDFDDVLALLAPRPLMVVAPRFDQEATFDDVSRAVAQARVAYQGVDPNESEATAYDYNNSAFWRGETPRLRSLELYAPPDYNHFTNTMEAVIYNWIRVKWGPASERRRR